MNKRIFWSEEVEGGLKDEKFHGGYYFRAFDLIKFMKLVEKEEGEVVGLCFEDNNVDIIIRDNEQTK